MNAVDTHARLVAAYRAGEISTEDLRRALLTNTPVSLSAGQKGLWALHQTVPGITAYQIPLAFRCDMPLDGEALREAYRSVLAAHPLLTCRMTELKGEPALQPQSPGRFDLRIHAAAGMDDAELTALLLAAAREPMPLDGDALIDATIYQLDEGRWAALFRVHHIVFDGTSAVLFLTDLFDAYLSLTQGGAPRVAPPSASYREFVAWQRAMLGGPDGARHLAYWRETLADAPGPLALPVDYSRAGQPSFDGASLRVDVPAAMQTRIAGFCDTHDLSRAVLYLGVFNGLLGRYAQRDDLIVGMPALGRPGARFDSTVGYFINMLPIRSRDVGSGSALDYLRRLRGAVLDALDHADYPFPTLVRALKVQRDSGQRPLFDVAFAYQNFAHGHWLERFERDCAAPLGIAMLDALRQEGEYELELEVIETRDGGVLNIKYAADLYARDRIERLARHYLCLMDGVLADPERPLGDHDILTDAEQALLRRCNATDASSPPIRQCVEWIAAQAARAPERVAVRHGEHALSYAELMREAAALANRLRAQGIGPGAKVAICVERSLDLPRAILGVLSSGAAYVPLDPRYPAERQRYMLEDSGASLLLTQSSIGRDWTPACATLCLDVEAERTATYADSVVPELTASDASQPAYLIYTSGSTGHPKGVTVPHRALNNFLAAFGDLLEVDAEDTLLAVTTFSFDIAALELLLPLVRGATCVLCDADVAADAERLKTLVERVGPTLMQATPTTWQMLYQVGWRPSADLQVLCGGEALPPALRKCFAESGARGWNLYGPTETTIWSSAKRLDGDSAVTIGAPVANTRMYVLDARRRLQPVGVPGELAIAGAGLADGYHGLPEQTAAKFVDDPFQPGERMFLTGDVAVFGEDGEFRCLGRCDQQIKLRGYRIDVEEIEACLVGHCPVDAAVVVLHEGAGRSPGLVAYLVPRAGEGNTEALEARARAALAARLPVFMVPQRYVCDATLPLTANGKVDRRALGARPLPAELPRPGSGSGRASGATALVRDVWRDVLGYSVDDDAAGFFDFGGDSVSAVQVAQRLSERVGRKIEVTLLFQHPTIGSLGAALDALGLGASASPAAHGSAAEPAVASGVAPARMVAAVVGISCAFAESPNLDAFWDNLCAGRACVTRWSEADLVAFGVPDAVRLDPRFVPAKAVLAERDAFDAAFFGLSPRDAAFMSPSFRQLLMHAWRAFEDAGRVPAQTLRTAVYVSAAHDGVGASPNGRAAHWIEDADDYVRWLMAQGGSMPTMISHKLGLTGPSLFVQSNCSSSLVALQAGLDSLRGGAADYALVGAANVLAAPMAGYLHQSGLNFSSDGQCRAFAAGADGMVGGEGVAMLLLKRADLAVADGDAVYAWLDDVQVNNDGALKAGFFAPSVAGQAAVIEGVLARAGVDARDVGYVETHGTGTALGDPIELAALREAFGTRDPNAARCGLGSVKSNIGHTDTVAGLAGAIKAILCLDRRMIPPTLHAAEPNPHLALADSPFELVDRLRAWPDRDGQTRHAAVSAFGVGGTNAHALFRAADRRPPRAPSGDACAECVVLSAKTPDKLAASARDLLAFTSRPGALPALAAAAWTLQVGRTAWPHRLAIVARDWDDVRRALSAFVDGTADACLAVGRASRGEPAAAPLGVDADAHALARHWVAGGAVAWPCSAGAAHRVHLPTYPFTSVSESATDMPSILPVDVTSPLAAQRLSDDTPVTHLLPAVPCWEPHDAPPGPAAAAAAAAAAPPTAVICINPAPPLDISGAVYLNPCEHADEAALEHWLRAHSEIVHWVWLLPDDELGLPAEMAVQQRWGVLWGARFLRALGRSERRARPLRLTVVTRHAVAILDRDRVVATHAGVHGLVGTVVKEQPSWQARLVDLDEADETALAALDTLPFERSGQPWARRRGGWFRPALRRIDAGAGIDAPVAPPAVRRDGVYVVIGGAGALGRDWTEHMLATRAAQVVWIGRRAPDDALRAELRRLGALGPEPLYLQADATDPAQLARACAEVRARFPRVHGVVHAAMRRENQPLHRQDLAAFEANLAAKTLIALNLAQAFEPESLDFLLFFSSVNAFYLNPNSAAYAAGGSFLTSFADQLNQCAGGCAKVIYWGHWDTPALRADRHGAKRYLAKAGYGTLDAGTAMPFLDALLEQPSPHLALFAVTHEGGIAPLWLSESVLSPKRHATVAGPVPAPAEQERAQQLVDTVYGRLDDIAPLLCALMWRQIATFADAAGLAPAGQPGRHTLTAWSDAPGRDHYLARWVDASLRILADRDEIVLDGDTLIVPTDLEARARQSWPRWEALKAELANDPFMASITRFIDVALQATPDVLAGRKKATDVFFSNSSLALVESIYKENPVVHYYGAVVGALVAARVEAIVAANPHARIRLLEIGAGTGSCTDHVLGALEPFAAHIDEYCFTDISQLFLQRAERRYKRAHPYLTTRLLNIEKAPAGQGFTEEQFEFVIAANVVHATQDIRVALRHAQGLMKRDGSLVLLELTENSLFSHLTFGLLEGWWRFSDPELRQPHGPALAASSWRGVLLDQGFAGIVFPCDDLRGSDLQVVLAQAGRYRIGPDPAWRPALPPAPVDRRREAMTDLADTDLRTGETAGEEASGGVDAAVREPVAAPDATPAAVIDTARTALLRIFCDALEQTPDAIDPDESLGDYGLDSIVGVKIVQQINAAFAIELVAGALFEFNTLNALARHVAARQPSGASGSQLIPHEGVAVDASLRIGGMAGGSLCGKSTTTEDKTTEFTTVRTARTAAFAPSAPFDVAIVGMSGQFPGAPTLDAFWRHVEAGTDCVVEVPAERWDWRAYFGAGDGVAPRTLSKWGGFIDGAYQFDPLFFDLSPYEATVMDPQQRLLLKHAWLALDDAGIAPKTFAARTAGVFLAVGASEYAMTAELPVGNPLVASSLSSAMVANRISHLLNLRGPSEHYDTGCSSSLVALHRALTALATGECEQALVGGVQLVLSPFGAINLGAMGFLSETGRSRSFQAGADGFVRAEGVGMVVLKPLTDALTDGDDIYAVLKGSGVAHGGKGVSLTAPNAAGMRTAIAAALARADLPASALSYVETHGIASEIGDSIEIQALISAFEGAPEGRCALSSLKPVIGHAEIASGMAALIKTALALRHRVRPGVPGFEVASAQSSLARSPFSLQARCRDWPASADGQARRAGVHSFGFGGVNAFAVLEESPRAAESPARRAEGPCLMPLSAKTPAALRGQVEALLAWLEHAPAATPAALAATLWRRTAFPVRLAVVATDFAQVAAALRGFLAGDASGDFHQGNECERDATLAALAGSPAAEALVRGVRAQRDHAMLARLWCGGLDIGVDPALAGERRLHLPGYSFDERMCRLPARADSLISPSPERGARVPGQVPTPTSAPDAPDDGPEALRAMLAGCLRLAPEELDFTRPIGQYGVDSLMAVMLRNQIDVTYGVRVALHDLMRCRTFADLAARLPVHPTRRAVVEPRTDVTERYSASVGQRGLWIEQRHAPARTGHNVPYAFRFAAPFDERRAIAAATRLVSRHPLLGANFDARGDRLEVREGAHAAPRCVVHESWRGAPAALTARLIEIAAEPFDLGRDPLLRVDIVPEPGEDSGAVVLFTFHHVVFDGSSLPVFMADFLAYYDADVSPSADGHATGYGDFVAWQRDWLASEAGDNARAFWRRLLGDAHMPARLDGQRAAAEASGARATRVARLPAATLDGLDQLASRGDASRYCTMLGAFGVLLGAHGAGPCVRIATPYFGRPHARFEALVGNFVNLLVIPVDTQAPTDVTAHLRALQSTVLDAIEHGHYPYPVLHRELGERDTPLFDSVFMYQNWLGPMQRRLAGHAKRVAPIMEVRQQADFPLAFEVLDGVDGATLLCHFDMAVFTAEWVDALQAAYLVLLARWASLHAPAEAVDERETVPRLHDADEVDTRALSALFDAQVARNPTGIALIHGEETLDYASLDARVERIARAMRRTFAPRGDVVRVVGLLLEPGFDFVAGTLAAWRIGAAYLALDPAQPRERLAYMCADSGVALLVSDASARQRLTDGMPVADTAHLDLDALHDAPDDAVDDRGGQTCCYVIYTSGSSGRPKGVKGSARGTLNRLEWGWRQFPFAADEVGCQKTSLNFVDHVAELFSPLLRGVPTLIVDERLLRERGAVAWLAALRERRVSRLVVIPSLLRVLLREPGAADALAALRLCVSSGEPLPRDLATQFFRCCPDAQLVNLYGSSEMSADATCKHVAPDEEGPVSIGAPIDGARVLVIDDAGKICAPEVEGELLVGGRVLADGYFGDAPGFVRLDPDGTGARRYFRSGDLGYRRANGELVLLGRRDRQMKINGQRIEPGEIETALRAHDAVMDAVVVRGADPVALEAYLEMRAAAHGGDLRDHLARALPRYMLPGRFHRVDALPRLPSGKIDRARVRAAPGELLPFAQDEAAPETRAAADAEARALEIVAGLANVSVDTLDAGQDFHQLGFDSFRFVQLADALNQAFGTQGTPADFYRHATVRAWLKHCGAAPAAVPRADVFPGPGVRAESAGPGAALAGPRAGPTVAADEPIAVIGMAGALPGCDDLAHFWRHMMNGTDLVTEAPAARWRWQDYVGRPGGDALRWGGFLSDVDKFSPGFFGLSPLEAEFMDPQHRLFLEAAWHALEDAGYAPRSLPERAIGVFVGVSSMDYASTLMGRPEVDPLANFGNGHSMLANRVSYLFDLQGPSVAIDTACSSSLVAIHEGIKAIRNGDCRWALVGGVNVLLEPRITLAMGKARMLSPRGRCRTFAADADGYVRGEGVGALLLKPLRDALADGDPIHALIRGSAVNHGGRANSMTAPNPAAQAALIAGLYRRLGVRPGEVGYIETHGTGTPIGDPIEVNALKEVWRDDRTARPERCALGAVKSNLGHLEAAAGIAGALKVLLCLRHRTLVPNLHCAQPNPSIALSDTPFYLPSGAEPWQHEGAGPRRAGLSSFGIGGTNAHVLFEEFQGIHHAE
ncbi:amino acid adenylation domain-containing protein [Burkholderia pyrrocinia]